MTLPIRLRLTVLYAALLAAILLAAGMFVTLRTRAELVTRLDESLHTSAAELVADYGGSGTEREFRDASDTSLAGLPRDESAAQLLSPTGHVLDFSGIDVARRAMVGASTRDAVATGARVTQSIQLGASAFRVVAVPFAKNGEQQVLVVATSLADVDTTVHGLAMLFVIGGLGAVVAAVAIGAWMARTALKPVDRMTDEASAIGVAELGERLDVPSADDELRRLAETLNAMLDRLQRGVEQERRFVSDASHELRTPLAVMRSEIDVSLGEPDLTTGAREALESAGEETERMTKIVEDLLTLARIDEGQLRLRREPLDLGALVEGTVSAIRGLARRAGVSLELASEPNLIVDADPGRIEEVVTNLLDNAVNHSPTGGVVRVSVRRTDASAEVSIEDAGAGITADALPHVFDRFFRADRSRSRVEGGSGLGLAISREIAEEHGGRVRARSEVGVGSEFVLSLPLVEGAQRFGASSG